VPTGGVVSFNWRNYTKDTYKGFKSTLTKNDAKSRLYVVEAFGINLAFSYVSLSE